MSTYSFYTLVHQDRFSDLMAIVGNHVVIIDLVSFGEDRTVKIHIKGEAGITRKLDRVLQSVKHLLTSAPAYEEA